MSPIQIRGPRRDERMTLARLRGLRTATPGRLDPLAAARERRVGGDELVEPHLGVAERDAEPVVRRVAIERREAGPQQEAQHLGHAELRRERHGRNVLGSRQRTPRQQRPAIASVVVPRAVEDAWLRGREMRRDVGEHGRGRQALLERQRVRERLQRRSRLARATRRRRSRRHVPRRSSRPNLPTPATRRVALSSTTTATFAAPCRSSRARWLLMMPATSACSPASIVVSMRRAVSSRRDAKNPLDEVRRRERRLELREGQMLIGRLARLFGGDQSGCLHPPQHGPLPREGRLRVSVRIEAGRTLRQAGQERRLRRRQHRRVVAEVRVARSSRADYLIAVRREVQVQREDLVLGEPMLQTLREHRLLHLAHERSRSRRCLSSEQQLGGLLRDRRSALDDLVLGDVPPHARERSQSDRCRGARRSGGPPPQPSPQPASAAVDPLPAGCCACRRPTAPRTAARRGDRRRPSRPHR